jgi:N6-adenosine-specific RNA methylase IME4
VTELVAARSEWADRITAAWRTSVEGVIEVGRLLAEARKALDHGEFTAMIDRDLPFKARTAQRLMKIADDERLSNPTHVSLLPPHWGTLYELTKLTDAQFAAKVASGQIHPELERRDVVMADIRERRAQREAELGARIRTLPNQRYGAIYADPAWRWETWSRETGLDRAGESHYPTMTLDAIKALDVPSIAADDCALFLWATAPALPQAFAVIVAWGFSYRSSFVWVKDRIGAGYWNRNRHEHLLVGVKGDVPEPAPGTQWPSVVEAPVGAHSAKPAIFYELIEAYFPHLPRIELFARAARPACDRWGAEAPTTESGAAS